MTSHDHLRAYLKSPAFKKAEEKLLARGIRVLSTEWNADRGPYRVLVSAKPVLNADDLKGLKVRMFPNQVYVRSWKQLETVPIQLAWTETYLGIRQGVVNAVTAPLSLVRSMKFTEVAPFIVEIREYPQTWPITVSERTWKKLSEGEQQLLIRAANEAGTVYAKTTIDRAETDVAAMIRDNNAVVIKLDTEAMRAKLRPLYADLIKEKALSKELFDAVNALPRCPSMTRIAGLLHTTDRIVVRGALGVSVTALTAIVLINFSRSFHARSSTSHMRGSTKPTCCSLRGRTSSASFRYTPAMETFRSSA